MRRMTSMRGDKFALLSGTAVLGVVLLSVAGVSPAGAQNAIDIQKVCGNIVGGDPVNIDPSVPFSAGQQFGCAIKVTDTGTSPLRIDLVQDRVQHVPPVGDITFTLDPADARTCTVPSLAAPLSGLCVNPTTGAISTTPCTRQADCGFPAQRCGVVFTPNVCHAFAHSDLVSGGDISFRCSDPAATPCSPIQPCPGGFECVGACLAAGTVPRVTARACDVSPGSTVVCPSGQECVQILPDIARAEDTSTVPGTPLRQSFPAIIGVPSGSFTVSKSPKNATYDIGDNVNFTITVTSTGPGVAKNVVLNDPLPTLGNLNSWSITGDPSGRCTLVATTLNCPFGDLANGQSRTVTVATTATGGADLTACPGNQKLNNTATATSTGLPPKSDTGDYLCTPGSFTVTKTPKNATYDIGDNVNFTVVVTSTGPGVAKNVVLNDPLPTLGNLSGWSITGDPSGRCTLVANTLNCPFGDLANGQTRTVIVATTATGGANTAACPGGVKLNNTATVTATGLQPRSDTGDYLCTPGSFTVTKTPKNATYDIGDNVNFTVVVASTGPGVAKNVVLNDPLPTLGNMNSWSIASGPTGGSCSIVANTLRCVFGELANGQTRMLQMACTQAWGAGG